MVDDGPVLVCDEVDTDGAAPVAVLDLERVHGVEAIEGFGLVPAHEGSLLTVNDVDLDSQLWLPIEGVQDIHCVEDLRWQRGHSGRPDEENEIVLCQSKRMDVCRTGRKTGQDVGRFVVRNAEYVILRRPLSEEHVVVVLLGLFVTLSMSGREHPLGLAQVLEGGVRKLLLTSRLQRFRVELQHYVLVAGRDQPRLATPLGRCDLLHVHSDVVLGPLPAHERLDREERAAEEAVARIRAESDQVAAPVCLQLPLLLLGDASALVSDCPNTAIDLESVHDGDAVEPMTDGEYTTVFGADVEGTWPDSVERSGQPRWQRALHAQRDRLRACQWSRRHWIEMA
mmetsp:Transcript_66235/g.132921  ORF Transcript_66235/g.132921 Transcript_66235/m.132921 type:complete len:340 (-) Transcript_66235:18-1037(-)